MQQPLISIVTPSYNQGEFIEDTLLSVISQSYRNKEYMVIDGASTDNSLEIIKKYENHLSYWCSEKDNGQSDAINKGWKLAKGSIMAYLNSDDTLVENALEKVALHFEKHPAVGLVYGDCQVIDEKGNYIGTKKGKPLTYKKLLQNGQRGILQPAAFFNANIVKQVGYLDTKWHFSMDYDLILKIARITRIDYIPEALARYRIHSGTKSFSQTEKSWQENFRVREKYDPTFPVNMKINYWKYRLLKVAPERVERMIRKIRNDTRDRVILRSLKDN